MKSLKLPCVRIPSLGDIVLIPYWRSGCAGFSVLTTLPYMGYLPNMAIMTLNHGRHDLGARCDAVFLNDFKQSLDAGLMNSMREKLLRYIRTM